MAETVVFRGERYRRYPEADSRADRVYFRASDGKGYLHRAIYEHHNGPIPEGWHVHHRDGDPLNNDPSNLVCVSPKDHIAEHWTPERSQASREWMEEIQPLTKAWHRSAEGREWHRQHGHATWAAVAYTRTLECDQCGEEFEVTTIQRDGPRFCTNKCKSAWRRDAGLDDEDRTCASCGETFRVNRYSKTRHCSRECAWASRKRARLQPHG